MKTTAWGYSEQNSNYVKLYRTNDLISPKNILQGKIKEIKKGTCRLRVLSVIYGVYLFESWIEQIM